MFNRNGKVKKTWEWVNYRLHYWVNYPLKPHFKMHELDYITHRNALYNKNFKPVCKKYHKQVEVTGSNTSTYNHLHTSLLEVIIKLLRKWQVVRKMLTAFVCRWHLIWYFVFNAMTFRYFKYPKSLHIFVATLY